MGLFLLLIRRRLLLLLIRLLLLLLLLRFLRLLSALQLNITYRVYCLNPNMVIVWTTPPPQILKAALLHFCMTKDEVARHSRDFWVNAWQRAIERTTSMLYSDGWQSTSCSTQFHVENTVFFSVHSCCNVMVKQIRRVHLYRMKRVSAICCCDFETKRFCFICLLFFCSQTDPT
jgi:hypothetical protein